MPAQRTHKSNSASNTVISENRLPDLSVPSPSTIPLLLNSFLDPAHYLEDDGHIKRTSNAFFLFRSHVNEDLKQKGSAALLQDKHSQAVGRLWKTLSPKDKAPYLALANQVKAIHANAYPDYRYRPAKGQRAQGKRARKPATSSSPPSMSASPSPSSSSSSSLSSPPSLSPSSSRSRSSSSSSSSSPSPSSSSSEGTSLPFLVSCTSAGTVAEPAPFTSLSPFLFPLDEFPTNDSNPIVFDGNMDFPLDPQEMGFSQLVISTGNAFLEEQVQPSSYNHPYYHDGSFNPDAYNWPPTQPEEYQHPLSQTFPVDDVDGHVVGENNTFWNVDFFFGQCTPMAEDMILSIDPSLLHS